METLKNIYNIYVSNVLDIVLMTVIFYKIMLVVKGTRAIQIILGIVVILALTILTRFLNLHALTWLLNNFWLAAVIIFAVVFQNEIRNGLAQLGSKVWGTNLKIKDVHINEIVEAVEDFGERNVGALIAIENEVGLKNYAETGVRLNADISKELLLSIFKNKSAPLHDGAVIIYNNKILAAGCLFPLTHETDIKMHGTRHRAAIGLSEDTDAVVIVVSEETGQISVAYKGKMKRNISTAKLKEMIISKGGVLTK